MMGKNIYPLDFMERDKYLSIIKKNLPKKLSDVIIEEKSEFQTLIKLPNGEKLILYRDSSDHYQIELSQCPSCKLSIYNSLKTPFYLEECSKGTFKSKIWKLKSKKLSYELKKKIIQNYSGKVKFTGATPEQYFVLKIKGKNALVHMRNGDLHLNLPHPNKVTDDIHLFIEEFLKEKIKENKRRFKEIDVGKDNFEKFLQKNIGITIVKNFDKEVYDYLSGRDVWEIEDGFKIYDIIKAKDPGLRNYKTLVRSFSVAFEGFLIKFFLEIGFVDKEAYEQDPTTVNIFYCINKLRSEYREIIERRQKGLISKVSNIWNECRNNYLHSDMYSYSHLLNLEQAESKIIEILTTMKQLLDVLPLIKGEE